MNSAASVLIALMGVLGAVFMYNKDFPQSGLESSPSNIEKREYSFDWSKPFDSFERMDLSSPLEHMTKEHNDSLLWGTYRSGMYFGLRSRSHPQHVSAGLMWITDHEDFSQIRHECRQEDRLKRYGWKSHDGSSFAHQEIVDQHNDVQLDTYFTRLQSAERSSERSQESQYTWASRVQSTPLDSMSGPKKSVLSNEHAVEHHSIDQSMISLFFYIDVGCKDDDLQNECREDLSELSIDTTEKDSQRKIRISGEVMELGKFQVDIMVHAEHRDKSKMHYWGGDSSVNVVNVKRMLIENGEKNGGRIVLEDDVDMHSTLIVVQAIVPTYAGIDVVYTTSNPPPTTASDSTSASASDSAVTAAHEYDVLSDDLKWHQKQFDRRFESTFPHSKSVSVGERNFLKAAFSNLIGGTGYFYGHSTIQVQDRTVKGFEGPLYSAVPSRSFFPRGFLWDEGFHQLLISQWSAHISLDVLSHWMERMHVGKLSQSDNRSSSSGSAVGWIPREQILGHEARARVPDEFVNQHPLHANPPSLILMVERLLVQSNRQVLSKLYPYLAVWYNWMKETQRGDHPDGTFQWKGRDKNDGKLMPNTLSSGLDDYPRASHPSSTEIHVDLVCWMIKFSDVMARFSHFLGAEYADRAREYEADKALFLRSLDEHHWDHQTKLYLDKGDHSADGVFETRVIVRCQNTETFETLDVLASIPSLKSRSFKCPSSHPTYLYPLGNGQGGIMQRQVFLPGTIKYQFVHHVGYNSLFPLLLQVLPANSPKLKHMLDYMTDPGHLWSKAGLRSLSIQDPYYNRPNAPGDEPYWRGHIWINMNYLAVKALASYGKQEGPYKAAFQQTCVELQKNLVSNVFAEYERTGYLWEQYNGLYKSKDEGQGRRCHPFSGWTALVVEIQSTACI